MMTKINNSGMEDAARVYRTQFPTHNYGSKNHKSQPEEDLGLIVGGSIFLQGFGNVVYAGEGGAGKRIFLCNYDSERNQITEIAVRGTLRKNEDKYEIKGDVKDKRVKPDPTRHSQLAVDYFVVGGRA